MSQVRGKFVVPPILSEALEYHRRDASARLRVMLPGEILSYDSAKRTAQIKVGYQRVYTDGTVKEISAPLVDVPVMTLQGGTAQIGGGVHLGMPISAGDECLVFFADINIDAWYANGGQQKPLNQRRHHIADGFALVGPNSLANPITTFLTATEGGISTATAKIALDGNSGKATIQANGQSLLTVLTNLLTPLQAALAALGADPGLQGSTKTLVNTAAAAATATVTALGGLLQ